VQPSSIRSRPYVSHAATTWVVFRILGAAAVVAFGAVHLHEYTGPYGAIPTIGTLFLVNFVTSVAIGLVLLTPVEHVAGSGGGSRRDPGPTRTQWRQNMKRLFTSMATVGLAALLAACGSSGGGSSSGAAPAGSADTVSVATVPGVGAVLVDSTGHALYASDEEASGTVLCTGACTSFWKPLTPGASAPTAAAGTPALGVVDRPDGTKQVTADGRPLYAFVQMGRTR
jgi:predicted lipoprotein with Yx(FWY)xxD motif